MVRIRRSQEQAAADLHRTMERMMEQLFHGGAEASPAVQGWVPRVDVYETAEGILVTLEIPGVKREEIEIVIEGASLRVHGVRREPTGAGCMRWHQMEISYGPFERILVLPQEVDPEAISAAYADGFLRIMLRCLPAGGRAVPIEGR